MLKIFGFLTKIWIYDLKFNFWPKFGFLTKIWIFDQNMDFFYQNFNFFTKISILFTKILVFNPERPIYFYPLAADCDIKCHIFYFANFGHLCQRKTTIYDLIPNLILRLLSLTIFFLNDRKVVEINICFLKFLIFLKFFKTTNIKAIATFYRKELLKNKKFW